MTKNNNDYFSYDFYKEDNFLLKFFFRYFLGKILKLNLKKKNPRFVIFNQDYVSNDILIDGYYELKELKLLSKWLKNKINFGVALDIGAYIGNHSLFFSKYFRKVISFEPNPVSFELLNLNIKQTKNIKINNYGLSNKKSFKKFYSYDFNYGGSSVIKNKKLPHKKFNALFNKYDNLKITDKIDLIKIDVEGHEINVLKGMEKTLKKFSPIIVFESQKKEIINGSSKVIDFLKSKKYSKFYSIENYNNVDVNILDKIFYIFKFFFISRKKYILRRKNFQKKYYSFIIAKK